MEVIRHGKAPSVRGWWLLCGAALLWPTLVWGQAVGPNNPPEVRYAPPSAPPPPVGAGGQFPSAGTLGEQPATAPPRAMPFQLTVEEQAVLDLILRRWERDTSAIKTLSCEIEVWKTNGTFQQTTHLLGELKYQAPDKGSYHIQMDASNGTPTKIDTGEHWVCDGKSIFEFRASDKKLLERRLPPESQGAALITDSPLPFLFGAKAEELKKRFLMRDTTSPEEKAKGQIWLEAIPRYQHDAANFSKAEIILMVQTGEELLLPYGQRLSMSNDKSDVSHVFKKYSLNAFFGGISTPRVSPLSGWEHVVINAPTKPGEAPVEQPKRRIWNPFNLGGSK